MLLLFFKFCTRFKSDLCTYIRTLHNSKFIFLPLRRSFMFLSCFCCSLSSFCFNLKDALQPFFFFSSQFVFCWYHNGQILTMYFTVVTTIPFVAAVWFSNSPHTCWAGNAQHIFSWAAVPGACALCPCRISWFSFWVWLMAVRTKAIDLQTTRVLESLDAVLPGSSETCSWYSSTFRSSICFSNLSF